MTLVPKNPSAPRAPNWPRAPAARSKPIAPRRKSPATNLDLAAHLTAALDKLPLSILARETQWMLFFAIAVFLFGLSRISIEEPGSRVAGAGLIAIALWLLRWDIAWRTIRIAELPRFMAVSLLSGYVWLLAAGVLWIIYAADFIAGPHYDAMLHSIFLGFVVVMIFAHAPIILPLVMDVSMPFQNSFYAHLILLHLSLLLRIAGDLADGRLRGCGEVC